MPEPELTIDALESLAKHPGWQIVRDILARELDKANEFVMDTTIDGIAIRAIQRSASVSLLRWMRDGLLEQAIKNEREKIAK